MKVLHVAHAWPPASLGGTERYAEALARAQEALGAGVLRFGPGLPQEEGRGPSSGTVPGSASDRRGSFRRSFAGRGFTGSYVNPAVERAFAGVLARERPDIVHLHHLAHLSAGLAGLARAAGARVVLTLHDAWVACARGQLLDVDLRRCGGPSPEGCARCLAGELWAPVPLGVARRLPLRVGAVTARAHALRALLDATDLVLSPSRHLGGLLGIDATWMPLPLLDDLPEQAVAAPARAGRSGQPPVARPVRSFLFLGSMIPSKGPDVALAAFAAVAEPSLGLTLAGPSVAWRGSMAWSSALEACARSTPGVTWRGAVAPADVPALLDAHDALVFPSIWVENSPLVLREARARGLLVLASDVPGAREVAPEATFVPPGRPAAWSEALRAAAAASPRLRTPLVDAPSLVGHASALLARYESLLRVSASVSHRP